MKKRGLSHIEVILSFIIFMGAVGFALYFFSPTNSSRLVDTSLYYVNREISENITVNLKTYSINVNNSNGQINGPGNSEGVLAVNISGICENSNGVIMVINLSGDRLPSKVRAGNNNNNKCRSQSDDVVLIQNDNWVADDFIYIKLSEDLDENSINFGGNPPLNSSFYKLSTVNSEELFSEKRILKLNKTYYEDYYRLKSSLICLVELTLVLVFLLLMVMK